MTTGYRSNLPRPKGQVGRLISCAISFEALNDGKAFSAIAVFRRRTNRHVTRCRIAIQVQKFGNRNAQRATAQCDHGLSSNRMRDTATPALMRMYANRHLNLQDEFMHQTNPNSSKSVEQLLPAEVEPLTPEQLEFTGMLGRILAENWRDKRPHEHNERFGAMPDSNPHT